MSGEAMAPMSMGEIKAVVLADIFSFQVAILVRLFVVCPFENNLRSSWDFEKASQEEISQPEPDIWVYKCVYA